MDKEVEGRKRATDLSGEALEKGGVGGGQNEGDMTEGADLMQAGGPVLYLCAATHTDTYIHTHTRTNRRQTQLTHYHQH